MISYLLIELKVLRIDFGRFNLKIDGAAPFLVISANRIECGLAAQFHPEFRKKQQQIPSRLVNLFNC